MTSYVLLFVLGFGVVARVTRFVNSDYLAIPLRVWAISRWGAESKRAYLLECPWCASIWVAAPTAGVATWAVEWPLPGFVVFIGLWLTWAYLYGLVATYLEDAA